MCQPSLSVQVVDRLGGSTDCVTVQSHSLTSHTVSWGLEPALDCVRLQPHTATMFLTLLEHSPAYRKAVLSYWRGPLRLCVTGPETAPMDRQGGSLAQEVLVQMVEQEDALHWLSTLGGAYSNLGENSSDFAFKAGNNAMKQLRVVGRGGDITVMMKCWLFVGQSLLQLGNFTASAQIIRYVWNQCHTPSVRSLTTTGKLLNMCKGIWNRLRYERRLGTKKDKPDQEIEVEQKFQVTDDYRSRLEDAGASMVRPPTLMKDVYWDTEDLILLSRDWWLRQRDGVWELKVSVSPTNMDSSHSDGLTTYREVTGEQAVRDTLTHGGVNSELEQLVVMARVACTRENWRLGRLGLVVDRMEDGYIVGELEVMCNLEARDEAVREVEQVAARLGFTPQKTGKVSHCLRTQNVKAWNLLCSLKAQRAQSAQTGAVGKCAPAPLTNNEE